MTFWRPACRHKSLIIRDKVTSYKAQSLGPGVLVTPECPIPCLPMIDQRSWVTHLIRKLGRRVVYLGSGNVAKLGHKCTNIIAAWVGFFALGVRIEDAKIWLRVRASARTPLPTAVVRGKVAVYELLHEMLWVGGGRDGSFTIPGGIFVSLTLSPRRQSIMRSFVKYIAAIMRTRLCIQPEIAGFWVRFSWGQVG